MGKPTLNASAVRDRMTLCGIDNYAEMAARMGSQFERSYVSRVLRGDRPAQPSFVLALAAALGTEPVAILALDPAAVEAVLAESAA